ncbi:MAG TPA: tetratricopeptide repeat protein [Anaerolineae bacterium]|nr:tetratricopeptide repeat protein [Anaerolineae bacterium]
MAKKTSIYLSLWTILILLLTACTGEPSPTATPDVTPTPDSSVFYQRGLDYLDQGEYELAIEEFNRAAQLDPNSADIYANRGLAHHWLDAPGEANADYSRAIELDPDFYLTYYNRGVSFDDRGDHERAVADYRRAVERNPEDVSSHNNLAWGLAFYLDTNYDEALEHALTSVELESNDYNQDTLALVYLKLERYEDALTHYNEALTLNDQQAESYRGRGEANAALGNVQAAIEDYQTYLRLTPTAPDQEEIEAKLDALR